MSGPICPDCGTRNFEEIRFGRLKCQICDWKGKDLPRKITGREMSQRISERSQRYKELRKQDKLVFVRIWLQGSEEEKDTATDKIMESLDLSSISGSDYLFIPFEGDRSHIAQLKGIRGIKKLTVT